MRSRFCIALDLSNNGDETALALIDCADFWAPLHHLSHRIRWAQAKLGRETLENLEFQKRVSEEALPALYL